jgi:hypothetical protein
MPSLMPTTPTERLLWLALLLLVAGFLGGQWLNRQQANRAGKWIQAGLGVLGGRVTWHWSKSLAAGAEAMVEETRAPYRNIAIAYYMLTREFPPLWLWERIRGKQDLIAVRANLRLAPAREFEIVPVLGELRKNLDQAAAGQASADEVPGQPFAWQELSDGLGFGMRGAIDEKACEKAKEFLKTYGPYAERISLRRRNPHVLAFFRLGPIQARASGELWKALGELVKG